MGYPVEYPAFWIRDPSEWLDAAVKRAGVIGVTCYILRHTFASRPVMLGVHLKTVQVLMAHKSIVMTRRYAHLAARDLKARGGADRALVGEKGIERRIIGYLTYRHSRGTTGDGRKLLDSH